MATVCKYCKYLYPDDTSSCFSCGRSTVHDLISIGDYLKEGYAPFDEMDPFFGSISVDDSPSQSTSSDDTTVSSTEPITAYSVTRESLHVKDNDLTTQSPLLQRQDDHSQDASSFQAQNPTSVLQGEDAVPYGSNNVSEDLQINRDYEKEQRRLRRLIARQQLEEFFITLPWRTIGRLALVGILVSVVVSIWKNRYSILQGISSLLSSFISYLVSVFSALLPGLLAIALMLFLVRELFRKR